MEQHVYWISGQAFGPGYSGAFGQAFTLSEPLKPEHLAPGGQVVEMIVGNFPARVRSSLQVATTGIFKFENDVEDTFRAEALRAVAGAEERLSDDAADRQLILEDLISGLRSLIGDAS